MIENTCEHHWVGVGPNAEQGYVCSRCQDERDSKPIETHQAAPVTELALGEVPWSNLLSAKTRRKLAEVGIEFAHQLPENPNAGWTLMERTETRCAKAALDYLRFEGIVTGDPRQPENVANQLIEAHQRGWEEALEANGRYGNIHQRLHAAMNDKAYVQKLGQMAKAAGDYAYVRHDDVMREVRGALLRNRVVLEISTVDHECECIAGLTRPAERISVWTRVLVNVDFVNIDRPGDRIHAKAWGYGLDFQEKGAGKAISYAVKYILLKAMMLETGEDEEERLPLPADEPSNAGAPRPVPAFPAPSEQAEPTAPSFQTEDYRQAAIDLFSQWSVLPKEQLGPAIRHTLDVIGLDPIVDQNTGKTSYDPQAWFVLAEQIEQWRAGGVTWEQVAQQPPRPPA